jgi:hypothetical protein
MNENFYYELPEKIRDKIYKIAEKINKKYSLEYI